MARVNVLHVITQLSLGGASRAALTVAKYSARQGPFTHTLLSLLPPAGSGAALARDAGVPVLSAATPAAVQAFLAAADIVHLHFWNSPEVYELLRFDWPPARLMLWLHIAGDTPPQVITSTVAAFADLTVAASENTADLPVLRGHGVGRSVLIAAAPDFERLHGLQPQPHTGFNVGYIGSVDFEKMHPDFVSLHAAINVPGVRFIVCGAGGAYPVLKQQAADLGVSEKFEFRGYSHDLRPVLSTLDVFGYPLRPDNYSGAELALREAMYAAVPPVVFPYGGAGRLVTHEVTGLIAEDVAAYRAAIERLFVHPGERARLGRNARLEAKRYFGPEPTAARFNDLYDELLRTPKRRRVWSGAAQSDAERFVESLGDFGADFAASLSAHDLEACLAAEDRITRASSLLASAWAGGILQYRIRYVNDAYLRLWAGLALHGQGRPALAVSEFTAAAKLGLSHWRVAWYKARSAEACAAWEVASTGVEATLAAVTDFQPAWDLKQRLEVRHRARQKPGAP